MAERAKEQRISQGQAAEYQEDSQGQAAEYQEDSQGQAAEYQEDSQGQAAEYQEHSEHGSEGAGAEKRKAAISSVLVLAISFVLSSFVMGATWWLAVAVAGVWAGEGACRVWVAGGSEERAVRGRCWIDGSCQAEADWRGSDDDEEEAYRQVSSCHLVPRL
eukprot:768726-Hanusia_phi.AAC.6